jgi:hypothetical protein
MRVKFKKGKQRKFFQLVLLKTNSPSLRSLNQFGLGINYQTLKSYYNENRTISEDLFRNLCHLAHLNPESLNIEYLNEHWGQIKGGTKKKRL